MKMDTYLLTTSVLVLLSYYGRQDEGIINYSRKAVIKKLETVIMAKQNFTFITTILPTPMAARSKMWILRPLSCWN
jgi:hypothetical protein